jgi:type II secretory pathway component GspD/PulD (secretin)
VFQAKLRGWKRLAASLVLVPGLAGLGGEAIGVLSRASAEDRPATSAKAEEAREIMRQAREALDAKNYGRATELAQKAQALRAPSAFYDDSPEDLIKEINRKSGGKSGNVSTSRKPQTTDPKALVALAKQSMEAGDLDRAQDLATQAQANTNNSTRWGLFDDTPASVLKDVAKAKGRRDKVASERLLLEARTLLEKQATNKTERANNLAAAEEKVKQSARMYNDYGSWHFGEKPTSLMADIKNAREKEKLPPGRAMPESTIVRHEEEPGLNPVVAAPKATPKTVDANLASKKRATDLMREANAARIGGDFAMAKTKLVEASNCKASFGVDEETPDSELQRLQVAAQARIDRLCTEAKGHIARKEATSAETKLDAAHQLALSMGLDVGVVVDLRGSMKPTKATTKTEVAVGIVTPPIAPPPIALPPGDLDLPPSIVPPPTIDGQPIRTVSDNSKIDAPPPIITNGSSPKPAPAVVPAIVKEDKGRELLDKARLELRSGQVEAARKLCVDVVNGPYSAKDEAIGLLNTIDAEETKQKGLNAQRAFESGLTQYNSHNYGQALAIFQAIDASHLPAAKRPMLNEMIVSASSRQKAMNDTSLVKADTKDIKLPPSELPKPAPTPMSAGGAGTPMPLPGPSPVMPKSGADNLLKQQEALTVVEFQQLRSQALKIESEATARFGRGETDAALQDLSNFVAKVKASNLDTGKQNMLTRPIESRMERLRILKHQTDFLTKESKEKRDFRSEMTQDALNTQAKQQEVAKLLKQADKLHDEAKYKEAFALAQKAQQLQPDDMAVNATLKMTQTAMRRALNKSVDESAEKWRYETLTTGREVPNVSERNPLTITNDPDRLQQILRRDRQGSIGIYKMKTEKDKEIERKLTTNVQVNFKQTPLESVVDHLQTMTGVNFNLDRRALKDGNIDPTQPITVKLDGVSLKSALNIITQQAGLKFIGQDEAIRITTPKGLSGQLVTKSIPVGDLVVPVPNYKPEKSLEFKEMMKRSWDMAMNSGSAAAGQANANGNSTLQTPDATLNNGAGKLVNQPGDGTGPVGNLSANGTLEKELIRLITSSVKPETWKELAGEGSIEYYPLGLALVINQAPEVIEEVERLLDSLRKLQDLEVSIEVKVVSLAETFYERIGVDFAMGIRTNGRNFISGDTGTNQGLTGISNRNFGGNVVGLQAPGVVTPDLDIPIRSTSFARAIPPFGGFPNSFSADGGLSLGLAFLSDIQVQMFLEAAQGDQRTNVMQAPKLTTLNGTSAELSVGDFQFFTTGVNVVSVRGQLVFIPQNVPFQVGIAQQAPTSQFNPVPPLQQSAPGLTLNIQPVVSSDRRFVRLNISQSFISLISGTQQVPLTTIITPVFENGGQGQPVPFTQFLQQPRFSNIGTQTVVVVPDGGTVVMGGLKYMTEGRNEFGPPVLSKIPYVNRLFKNVSYGREGRSILIMVTPRIIINREEQQIQTGITDEDLQFGK